MTGRTRSTRSSTSVLLAIIKPCLGEHKGCAEWNPRAWSRCSDGSSVLISVTFAIVGNAHDFPTQSYVRGAFHWGGVFFCWFVFRQCLCTKEFCNLNKWSNRSRLIVVIPYLSPLFPHRRTDLPFTCFMTKFAFKNWNTHPANPICDGL